MSRGGGSRPGDRVTDLFDRVSAFYDTAFIQTLVYRPAQDEIMSELRRRNVGARVADVGCGTGILATRIKTELADRAVFGCDLSEGMLGMARSRTGTVGWVRTPSEALPFASGSIDAVVSSHAFHFFDQPAALAEFRRVLAPGGIVAVVIVNPRTSAAAQLLAGSVVGAGRFPDQPAMRRLFLDAGFGSVRQRRVRRLGARRLWPDLLTVATRA